MLVVIAGLPGTVPSLRQALLSQECRAGMLVTADLPCSGARCRENAPGRTLA